MKLKNAWGNEFEDGEPCSRGGRHPVRLRRTLSPRGRGVGMCVDKKRARRKRLVFPNQLATGSSDTCSYGKPLRIPRVTVRMVAEQVAQFNTNIWTHGS